MDIRRKSIALILALIMLFSMAVTVSAEENDDITSCIQGLLNYYSHYQDAAATDINCLLYQLSELDPKQGQAWASIMEYWSFVNNDMTLYPEILPNGLPQTNALCIVVLGYALADDGSMKSELIGRLEAALASAQKYPNAFILCTGGGTAQYNKNVTEAGQMAKWLINKGISKDRIIIEDESRSTASNAINSYEILSKKYPQVTHLAIVTSDYHLPRSCLLFHAQTTLKAMEEGLDPLIIAANASYQTSRSGPEDISSQLSDLSRLAGVSVSGMSKPALSKLERIEVSGDTRYDVGTEPNLQVIAHYDTGLYRDVSRRVDYFGLDTATAGVQNVTVAYEEGDVLVSATLEIEMLAVETIPPTEAPTEAPTEPVATESAPVEAEPTFFETYKRLIIPAAIVAVLVIAELVIIIRLIRLKKQERAAKAAAEREKLPDDDSPLEYV